MSICSDFGHKPTITVQHLPDVQRMDDFGSAVGVYRKTALTRAVQVQAVTVVMMPNGPARAEPGDYVCEDAEGKLYVCSKSIFEATYEKVN